MKDKNLEKQLSKILKIFISIMGYALILTILSVIFNDTIKMDNSYFGIWGILVSLAIYILNKTVKPIIFSLTLPITALTLGIFYPFINVLILNIVDLLFGNYFTIKGIIMSFIVAVLISTLNILMDEIVIKPILKEKKAWIRL